MLLTSLSSPHPHFVGRGTSVVSVLRRGESMCQRPNMPRTGRRRGDRGSESVDPAWQRAACDHYVTETNLPLYSLCVSLSVVLAIALALSR